MFASRVRERYRVAGLRSATARQASCLTRLGRQASRYALAALALTLSPLAFAGIACTGAVVSTPPCPTPTVSGTIFVGNGAVGTLSVDAGSTFTANTLSLGTGGTGNGTVTITGAASGPQTVVNLLGPPNASAVNNPLEIGNWGTGVMTVSGGAQINGLGDANCISAHCNTFIGQTAGSSGTLTLTGTGTTASLGGGFFLGNSVAFTTAAGDPFNFGTPGGTATGIVNVQSGATLNTYGGSLGSIGTSNAMLGTEQATAHVTVTGANSVWNVTQNPVTGFTAGIGMANGQNATAMLDVTLGGHVAITGTDSFLGVGNGGTATVTLASGGTLSVTNLAIGNQTTGSGTVIVGDGVGQSVLTATGSLGVGNSSIALSQLTVNAGGKVDVTGPGGLGVAGSAGSQGKVLVDGGQLNVNGTNAFFGVGNSGTGTLTVINGGSVSAVNLGLGGSASSLGTMTVGNGNGQSVVTVTNSMGVGNQSTALSQLTFKAGGLVYLRGTGDDALAGSGGSQGMVLVDGGQLNVNGSNAFFGVGNSGIGTLEIRNGGTVSAVNLGLGNSSTAQGTVTVGNGVGQSVLTVTNSLGVGNQSTALSQLTINAGGKVDVTGGGGLGIANSTGSQGKVLVDGGQLNITSISIGSQGTGSMTIQNGGTVTCAPAACNFSAIGNAAGSTGSLVITGPGSSFTNLGQLNVGQANVNTGFGTPGGTTTATLQVLAGGTLATTGFSAIANASNGPLANGNEHVNAHVTIDGAGSSWQVTRGTSQSQINVAPGPNTSAIVDIVNGGQIVITGFRSNPALDSALPGMNIGGSGTLTNGSATVNVNGAGSALIVNGDTGFLTIGRGATGALNITNGGQVYGGGANGLMFVNVGRFGSTNATLSIDGAGSSLTLSGVAGLNTGNDGAAAFMTVGRDAGSIGHANVTNGALLYINDGGQAANNGSPGLRLGRDATSTGIMTVSGVNTQVIVEQTGSGTSVPTIIVGQAGNGQMTITDHATVVVNGPSERDVIVGNAAGGQGTLMVSNGAQLTASWFTTGNNGGTGTSTIDNATVLLNGVALNPDQTIFGASVRVGRGTGSTGTLNLINGAQLIIDTATNASNINLGGTSALLGGNGTLNMSGGSSISFIGTGATPGVNIGHSGTGLFTMTGNSTLSLPDDGSIVLGNRASGNGTLQLGGGSTIDTGFLTVGNSGQGFVTMTGGTLNVHGTDPNADVFLVVGANSGAVGTFSQSGGIVSVDSLMVLGWQTGSSGSYTLSGGTLNSRQLNVADRGTGVFVNGAINNVAGLLIIGGDASANGSYTITGNSAQTNVTFAPGGIGPTDPPGLNGFDSGGPRPAPNGALAVGIGGTGTFTQGAANFSDPGNTVNVAGDLAVGVFVGGVGTYTLNTGTLMVGGKIVIGDQSQSANVFTQNGGSVTVTGAAFGNPDYVGLFGNGFSGSLTVGGGNDIGSGTGTYVLHGGTVTANLVQVGLSGTGTFDQTGGTVNTPTLWLGNCGGCNASGTYNLTGTGVINAGSESIGLFGHGEFTQNGASTQNNVAGALLIGDGPKVSPDLAIPNRSGVYTLVAGQLNTQSTVVGSQGIGTFNQSGGIHAVTGNLIVGRDNPTQSGSGTPGDPFVGGPSQGTYVMTGGVLTVGGNMTVGAAGTGTMQVSGGAGITLTGPGASLVIGDTGTGVLTMIEGSTIVLPGDGKVIVGAHAGASGTLELQGGSSIQAGAVFGIGHDGTNPTGAASANVYLDQGSSVTATNIYLGDGCLGGNGGVLHGNFIMNGQAVVNCAPPVLPIVHPGMIDPTGILHPGRSPGVLTFDGSFQFLAGTIVLEVESDGHGGFLTDEIIFTFGTVVDLTKANIAFAFLGDTNPEDFLPFWNLDTFLKTVSSGGAVEGISALGDLDSQFADASFTAQSSAFVITDFTFDPVEGVTSIDAAPVATAVPEPGSMMLLLLGCLLLAFARRRAAASTAHGH